ncbi:outer membrane efflux protein [Gloeothece citriformis PCC 7424]|uniref:Outer membrane efflux protein n=2 Tax=Gloeothece TaxID=28070 RepID=B7KFH2_GLOC7|nr:outer membrane efflux protein [Gloeothece citriformis PCC 7424]
MVYSTGILFFLGYGASVNAQTTPSQGITESYEFFPVPSRAADLMPLPQKTLPVPKVTDLRKLAQESSGTKSQSPLISNRQKLNQRQLAQTLQQPTSPQTNPPQTSTPPTTNPFPPPPIPEFLNPGANPLLYPTNPTDVDIRAVEPITLEQAVEIALKNNEQLQQARLALQRAQAELREARAQLYPEVRTNIDFERESNFGVDRQREAANETGEPFNFPLAEASVNGQVELNYTVFTAGERPARIRRGRTEVERNQLEVERIAEEVRFDAADAYYILQRADAAVAIAQAAVEDASVSLRDARLLEQAGLGTRFSVLQAEVDLSRANQDLTRAIADQRIARRRLAEILSVGQQIELTAADEIEPAGDWPISLEETIVQAYQNRAELQQQVLQKEINRQDSLIALATTRPQLDFIANYNFDDSFDDRFSVADGYFFLARIRWLIFDGGRSEAQARQAYRNMDIAQTEFARLRDEIRFNVEQAYFDLIANQENIQTAALNVTTATESLRLARLRFQAGVGTQIDVINAQRDLTQARSDYLTAIIEYNRSLNSLQRQVSNWPDNVLFDVF